MQRILFIPIIIVCLSFPAVVHADNPNSQAPSIVVTNVLLGDSTVTTPAPANAKIENPLETTMPISHIAITYEITNTSSTRKLTLEGNRKALLFDEFGNEYRKINVPADYGQPVVKVSKNFPSLYPGENYTETIFFEPPIPAAKKLKLSVNVNDLGMEKPAELSINIADRSSLLSVRKKSFDPSTLDIRIVDPPNGMILGQGDVIHIRIMAAGDKPPQKIIVIALNTYFEDKSPSFENVYDLNVPLDQAPGSYVVNVIAEWPGTTSENNTTLSDTLSFDVQETVPLPSL